MLAVIVLKHGKKKEEILFEQTTEFAMTHISNANPKIRETAYSVLIELYHFHGEDLLPLLEMGEGVKPPQMKTLKKAFKEIDGGNLDGAYDAVSQTKRQTSISKSNIKS